MKKNAAPATIVVGAVFGLTALLLDAATGHEGQTLIAEDHFYAFSVGLRIQQWHAVALLATGALLNRPDDVDNRAWRVAAIAFTIGILLFSGGLYLGGVGVDLGFLTPLGGITLMLGWVLLGVGGLLGRRE